MGSEELDDTDFETDIEDTDMEETEQAEVVIGTRSAMAPDARRRLEERLEEQRLKRQIADYDYDAGYDFDE